MQTRPEFVPFAVPTVRMAEAQAAMRARSAARFDQQAVEQASRVSGWACLSINNCNAPVSLSEKSKIQVIEIDPPKVRVTRLRKGLGVGAKRLHNMGRGRRENMVLVTLTYRGDNADWRPEHISAYIRAVRVWYKRLTGLSLRYAWVAELQKRGVIHYHVVCWLKKGICMPKADKRGWWPHGMTNTKKATAPVAYLMKYVSKVDSKNVGGFPRGARIFGLGGLDKEGKDCKRWVLWPAYLQGNAAAGDPFKPAKGGGYTNADTGEHFCSEFVPTGGGFKRFIRVHTHSRQVDASGPFSWLPDYVKALPLQ